MMRGIPGWADIIMPYRKPKPPPSGIVSSTSHYTGAARIRGLQATLRSERSVDSEIMS